MSLATLENVSGKDKDHIFDVLEEETYPCSVTDIRMKLKKRGVALPDYLITRSLRILLSEGKAQLNGRKWIDRCLQSILCQSYEDYEVIFVDNNSSDNSVEHVKNNYTTVTIVENVENSGFSRACNDGVRVSNYDDIIFLNSDTYYESDLLQTLIILQ